MIASLHYYWLQAHGKFPCKLQYSYGGIFTLRCPQYGCGVSDVAKCACQGNFRRNELSKQQVHVCCILVGEREYLNIVKTDRQTDRLRESTRMVITLY